MVGSKSGFYLSIAAIVVCAAVVTLVLASSLEAGELSELDLSRGRGLVIAVSSAILVASAIIVVRTRPEPTIAAEPTPSEEASVPETSATDESAFPSGDEAEDAVSSLPEDEQRLYDIINEAGGEMLQMHIVSSGVFSKAKVTRLLDKLEGKGLVVRERHGMTNRVRIIR